MYMHFFCKVNKRRTWPNPWVRGVKGGVGEGWGGGGVGLGWAFGHKEMKTFYCEEKAQINEGYCAILNWNMNHRLTVDFHWGCVLSSHCFSMLLNFGVYYVRTVVSCFVFFPISFVFLFFSFFFGAVINGLSVCESLQYDSGIVVLFTV